MPYFTRPQQGVILLLGAALLLLWAWRANFWRLPGPPPAATLHPVFVEVAGAVAHPGVYAFDHPPTLPEAWRRAGGPDPPPASDTKLASGSRLEVTEECRYHLARMAGPQLLTLGLALDLNQATKEDLEALPGIGPVMAERIIDFRRQHGAFKKIENLDQVPGIGPKKLEQIKPFLVLGGQEAQPPDLPEQEN
jgi:competence protein ComEA